MLTPERALNPEQEAACVHAGGPLLILAGAGSGKTRVITHRIAHLIAERAVEPSHILAVTFTNKAADEMRERVEVLLGPPHPSRAGRPTIGTFHAICARLLRKYAGSVGLSARFSIYDTTDQLVMVQRCAAELMLPIDRRSAREFLHAIDQHKNAARLPDEVHTLARGPEEVVGAELYARYAKRLREANAVDFGDLILLAGRLLEDDERVRRRVQGQWRHILVDEFQDTNTAQYRLLKALVGMRSDVTVVGDDDQSIYAWRGADVGNVVRFEEDFANTTVVKLERNYRSTQPILEVAGDLMEAVPGRHRKRLWTDRLEGHPVRVYAATTDRDEARFVARTIAKLCFEGGMSLDDVAVFYRVNAQSRILEEQLRGAGINHRIIGGIGFYERAEVKDLLAYLTVLVNPADVVAVRRVINTPPRGIGKKTLDDLDSGAAAQADSVTGQATLLDACIAGAHGELGLRKQAREGLAAFVELIESLRVELDTSSPSQVLQRLLSETRYVEFVAARDPERAPAILEHIEELQHALTEFEERDPAATLSDFLEGISLRPTADDDGRFGAVRLITIHGAKGLEFSVVFVVGLEDDLLPYRRGDELPDVDEERRLCYVAFTRAREQLYLCHAQTRRLHGVERTCSPSRFFWALKRDKLVWAGPGHRPRPTAQALKIPPRRPPPRAADEWVDPSPDYESETQLVLEREPAYQTSKLAPTQATRDTGRSGEFAPGHTVTHPKFGIGKVLDVAPRADGQLVHVHFPMAGAKKVFARFLRPL